MVSKVPYVPELVLLQWYRAWVNKMLTDSQVTYRLLGCS